MKKLCLVLLVIVLTYTGSGLAQSGGAAAGAGSQPAFGSQNPAGVQPAQAPLTTHPRLWLTQADLPRLRSWAVDSNPMYLQGLKAAMNAAIVTYNTRFFPGGVANPAWPDAGGIGWDQYDTEAYAQFFAFLSLVDNNPAARIQHATRARNLLMHVMNEAVKGPAAGQPFRDPVFITNNRANYWGEAFGLTVDWIYAAVDAQNQLILTSADKATIRTVFLRWANELLNAYTAGDEHPHPVGVVNSPALLADARQLRWTANNYYSGHMRILTLISLSMDAADDPALNPALAELALGNTLRSYIGNATGAWLYQQYAVYEYADTVIKNYGLPANTPGLGIASGGLSVEGFLYGHALGYVDEALLALYTAGYTDPAAYGPQINLIGSDFWDRLVDGYLHSITPVPVLPTGGDAYMGPLYQMASYGDIIRFWITPDNFTVLGALGVYDTLTNNQPRLEKERWFATHAVQGGAAHLYERASNVWGNANASEAILYFLLFDPAAAQAADPRPKLPTTFDAPVLDRILARTDWTPNASWFSFKCGWITINHQLGDCGQFEFYRKGEWLTKEASSYSNDGKTFATEFHNMLSLQNKCICPGGQPANLQWFETETWLRGGQWSNGQNAGDPASIASWSKDYVYSLADATNLYNRPSIWSPNDSAMAILHASRSVVWLKPDVIVVYDRALSSLGSLFKRFFLNFPDNPSVNGHTVTETTPSGQQLVVQSLLPLTSTIVTRPLESFHDPAQLDPIRYQLYIQDGSSTPASRFLTVLQGVDAGGTPQAAATIQSAAGTAFTGVLINHTAVMFPVELGSLPQYTLQTGAPFTSLAFSVPSDTSAELITGLKPDSGYSVDFQVVRQNLSITVTPSGNTMSDHGGVLALGVLSPEVRRIYMPLVKR